MKKIICILVLISIIQNTALAAKQPSTDILAKDIAAKTNNLKPKIVKLAIESFYRAKQLGVEVKKPILTIIDYTLASTQKRLWVIDLAKKEILYNSMVAHGKYSGDNYTTNFSNKIGSLQTSVGVFLTENTYFGRDGYSLRLEGLERGFNDNAKERLIVLHGAPYVNNKFAAITGRIGRSWGCPAVEKPLAKPIINTIKNGTLLFSFYNHKQWLAKSVFVSEHA
jgi:hypothetical protein